MRVAIATVALASLAACAADDNSPAAFESKTGIRLCAEARVERIGANDPKLSPGIEEIYLARLQMSPACARQFIKDLEESSGSKCTSAESCGVRTRRGFNIIIQKEGDYYMVSSLG